MSLGPIMVDIGGTELAPQDVDVLRHPLVGSVLLFSRNYQDPAQLRALTASIRDLRSPHLLIAVDHEGGRVQRFRDGFTPLPSARLLGRRFREDRREGWTGWRETTGRCIEVKDEHFVLPKIRNNHITIVWRDQDGMGMRLVLDRRIYAVSDILDKGGQFSQ